MTDETSEAGETSTDLSEYGDLCRRIDARVRQVQALARDAVTTEDNHLLVGVADFLEDLKIKLGEKPNYLRLTRGGWLDDPEEWRRQAFEREQSWKEARNEVEVDQIIRARILQPASDLTYSPDLPVPQREEHLHRVADSMYRWATTGNW